MKSWGRVALVTLLAAALDGASPGRAAVAAPGAPHAASPSQSGDFEARKRHARAVLLEDLLEYGEWCSENKLFGARQTAYEYVLKLDPENEDALRGLGYTKKKTGWEAPSKPKTYRDLDESLRAEQIERWQRVPLRYVDVFVQALESERLSPSETEFAETQILRHDPDNAFVHERRGEVLFDASWVLPETVRASARRIELDGIVRDALFEAPPPTDLEPRDKERTIGLAFQGARTDDALVYTTGPRFEAEDMTRALAAARSVFSTLFGVEARYPPNCTIYLLAEPGDEDAFLANHPSIDASYAAELANLEGSGIVGTNDWAFWTGNRQKRLDGIVRMAIGYFFLANFDVKLEHGWLEEGLGLYVTKALVGTRLTWFVSRASRVNPKQAFASRAELLDPSTNWIRRAFEVIDAGPDFDALFAKGAADMSVADLLVSYALAAYLLEAVPDRAPEVVARVGAGEPSRTVFEWAIDEDVDAFRPDFARWIRESYAAEFVAPLPTVTLIAAWEKLDAEGRDDVLARFGRKLKKLDTHQLDLIASLKKTDRRAEDEWPGPPELEYYDPSVHAPAQPIPRHVLDPDGSQVRAVRRQFFGNTSGRELIESYRYDWPTRAVVRVGDPNDPDTLFHNAANGYPPGLDLARALALRALDGGDLQKTREAFGHLYTDRDGGVYPGITIDDGWCSRTTLEMPDVDTLGIIHDVLDDWRTWVAPVPASEHDRLYGVLGKLHTPWRRYRALREALADLLVVGEPASEAYVPTRTNLHALWASVDDDPSKLGGRMPLASAQVEWVANWVEECKLDSTLWDGGVHRRSALKLDGDAVVLALADALREAGALPKDAGGGVSER